LLVGTPGEAARVDIARLQSICKQRVLAGAECYEALKAVGLEYGPAHQAIEAVYSGVDGQQGIQVLAKLKLPGCVADEKSSYVLHPSMMDAALQASIGLMVAGEGRTVEQVKPQPWLPFSLEQLDIAAASPEKGWAWLRYSEGGNGKREGQKVDIDVCDEQGKVCVGLKGLTPRILKEVKEEVGEQAGGALNEAPVGTLMLVPVWDVTPVERNSVFPFLTEKLMIVGGTENHLQAIR